jgi:hypothetical protein
VLFYLFLFLTPVLHIEKYSVAVADYDEHRVVRRVTVGKNITVNQKNEVSTLLTKK